MPDSSFLQGLADKWPTPYVLRGQVGEFTNSLISPNYIRMLDQMGKGPRRVMLSGKVTYPVQDLIEWMATRITADIPSKVMAPAVVEDGNQTASDAG